MVGPCKEKERLARAELRVAEEAQDRLREEQRRQGELRRKDLELERLREELEITKVQAQDAQKSQSQLEIFKKRLEDRHAAEGTAAGQLLGACRTPVVPGCCKECQVWKREKEELRKQLDEISSSNKALERAEVLRKLCTAWQPPVATQAGSGTVEHLHGRLAQLRDDVAQVSLQRDQAQMQMKRMQAELETWRSCGWVEAIGSIDLGLPPRFQGEIRRGARSRRCCWALPRGPVPAPALAAPLAGQLPSEEREKLLAANRDLQSQVALRERELQVFNWRSQAESNALKAQEPSCHCGGGNQATAKETLMASCFHELGLRYHQLQLRHARLKRRNGEDGTEEP
eukprot:Skav205427  [mRNA]  locus=scaffold582:458366:467249:- [translate_table: standard]